MTERQALQEVLYPAGKPSRVSLRQQRRNLLTKCHYFPTRLAATRRISYRYCVAIAGETYHRRHQPPAQPRRSSTCSWNA